MTTRRWNRIFRTDGRALVVATDHGMISGPDRGIEQLDKTLPEIVAGGADAVMASYGTATRFATLLARVGLVLRIDGAGAAMVGVVQTCRKLVEGFVAQKCQQRPIGALSQYGHRP